MKLIKKIMKYVKNVFKECFYHYKNFGLKYSFSFFATSIFRKYKYKTRLMAISILEKEFNDDFFNLDISSFKIPKIDNKQKNIFIFWAQGIDKLPDLQKECLERIKFFYSDYNICLLDLNNFKQYVHLEKNIIDLFNEKKITIETFSDILRFNLLYQVGGIWCDSTLLFFRRYNMFETIQKNGFLSINHDSEHKSNLWRKVYNPTYTTFFLGTYKGNDIMKYCVMFYNKFYQKHDFAIDYFMNDYILCIIKKHHIDDDMLSKIPYTTGSPFALMDTIEEKISIDINAYRVVPQKIQRRNLDFKKLKTILNEADMTNNKIESEQNELCF